MAVRLGSGMLLIAALVISLLLTACGGHKSPSATGVLPTAASPATGAPADALSQLESLETPDGVDAALFAHLKDALAEALKEYAGKSMAQAPTGSANHITDLAWRSDGADGWELFWHYRNAGDYDQDGVVGIPDITPLAIHYGACVGEDPLAPVIDGSGDGIVGIADITPLAQNYGSEVSAYVVFAAQEEDGPSLDVGRVPFSEGMGGDIGHKVFTYSVPGDESHWYAVGPEDSEGGRGEMSMSTFFEGPEVPPEILDVQPQSGLVGHEVTFEATVLGAGPFTWAWDFGGGAEPNTSDEESPTVTLGEEGEYDASLTVTNDFGEDTYEFTLLVYVSPPVIVEVEPTAGAVGTQVAFRAIVEGAEPIAYAWDFGGGAEPNTSDEESPTVTLGEEGDYSASLLATNEYGEDLFEFTLRVGYPPKVESVAPTSGQAWAEVQFTAEVTGTEPISYEWNFGGGAEPNTSGNPSPTVTLNDGGRYDASLSVSSPFGEDTYLFTLDVNSDWVHTWGNPGLFDEYGNGADETATNVAVDEEGSVYVVGRTWTGPFNNNATLLKYDRSGNLIFSKRYSEGQGHPTVTLGGDGSLYMTVYGDDGGQGTLDVGGIVLLSCNRDGDLLWCRGFTGPTKTGWGEGAWEYAVTAAENALYLAGKVIDFPGSGYAEYKTLVAKFDLEGNIAWSRLWPEGEWGFDSNPSWFRSRGIALDSEGNVYVAGYADAPLLPPSSHYKKVFLLKHSPEGQLLWYSIWADPADFAEPIVTAITIDRNNHIYVVGHTDSGDGDEKTLVLKYDKHGGLLWARRWGVNNFSGAPGGDHAIPHSAAIGPNGHLYTAGRVSVSSLDVDFPLLLECDAEGHFQLAKMWSVDNYPSSGEGIALDSRGHVYIAGSARSSSGQWLDPPLHWSDECDSLQPSWVVNDIPVELTEFTPIGEFTESEGIEDAPEGDGRDYLIMKHLLE